MAKDTSDGKSKDKAKDKDDSSADKVATKRVELIDQGDPSSSALPGYIGVGLIGGFILGFGPLRDAVQGVGPFEDAMVRFLACILVCVAAASILGRILESAPPAEESNDSADAGDAGSSGSTRDPLATTGDQAGGDLAT